MIPISFLKTSSSASISTSNNSLVQEEEYVLKFDLNQEKNTIFGALSNFQVGTFSLKNSGELSYNGLLGLQHNSRINDIFVDENILYTCSNDQSCKLLDLNSNKLIKTFKRNKEIYSISKSKHILAGADESGIVFWDLRTMKQRNEFNETHGEEVTCIKFNNNIPTQFVSSSLDGMLCLFDLSKENEEEACQSIIRTDQPVDRCGYINDEIVYGITTVDSVFIMNTQEKTVLQNISAIQYDEFNKDYLIDAFQDSTSNQFKILVGREKGFIEERSIEKVNDKITQVVTKILKSQHTSQIRQIRQINENLYITAAEDGSLQILTPTQEDLQKQMVFEVVNKGKVFESKMEEEAFQLFDQNEQEDGEIIDKKSKKSQKKNTFNPN